MVAISLYRGNLHRVPPTNPRRWPMPPPAISLRDFKLLTLKRSRALAVAALPPPPPHPPSSEEEADKGKEDEEGMGDSDSGFPKPRTPRAAAATAPNRLDPQGSISRLPVRKGEDVKDDSGPLQESKGVGSSSVLDGSAAGGGDEETKMEVTDGLDIVGNEEDRKTKLENKLQVLNEKKHNLVQMLKQILHAEEEIKRRNIQSSGFRASFPIQQETAFEMGSVTRHAQKLSVDVNFGGDLGGEGDAAANNNIHTRNMNGMNSTSPSATSLTRPKHGSLQQNTVFHNPRATMVAAGHVHTHPPNATSISNTSASPSPFSPAAIQGHATCLTPMSAPGTNFTASTPSPAASGGVSSVFRDAHLTSSL